MENQNPRGAIYLSAPRDPPRSTASGRLSSLASMLQIMKVIKSGYERLSLVTSHVGYKERLGKDKLGYKS